MLQNDGRLHHNPILVEQPDYDERLDYTRLLYCDVYHSAPPPDIWGVPPSDIVEEEEGEKFNIFVHLNGYDPFHMKIRKNTLVKTVINACRNFFKLRLEDTYTLLFDSDRMRTEYLPNDLEDNDSFDLRYEITGC